jgi:inosine/xanthosine triphosphate pyrophosphatase family protein
MLIATTNAHKRREIRGLLAHADVRLSSLTDLPPVAEPEETGATFQENARLKALYYAAHLASCGLGADTLTVAWCDKGSQFDGGSQSLRCRGAQGWHRA